MKSQVVAALAALKAAYPRQALDQATLKIYAEMLADTPPEALAGAVKRLMATSRFFPTIAEIRQEIAREQTDLYPAPELAWDEVVRELRRVGHTGAPVFSCPEIDQAVRAIGGWEHLCLAERNPYDRARFVDAYRAALERTTRYAQLGPALTSGLQGEAKGLVGKVARRLGPKVDS